MVFIFSAIYIQINPDLTDCIFFKGIPKCRTGLFCNIGAYAVSFLAYFGFIQKNFVQATYWHDPFNEEIYRKHNNFLADINQEQVLYTTVLIFFIEYID